MGYIDIYMISKLKKVFSKLKKVCGSLCNILIGLLFWLGLHFALVLGLVGIAEMWSILLYCAVL